MWEYVMVYERIDEYDWVTECFSELVDYVSVSWVFKSIWSMWEYVRKFEIMHEYVIECHENESIWKYVREHKIMNVLTNIWECVILSKSK